jgi:glycosyltransferase involved in cell wall biosynthesis
LRDGFKVYRCPCIAIIGRVNPVTIIMHKLLSIKADVIHAHSYIFFTSNQAALARSLTKTPFMLHLHGGMESASIFNANSSHLLSITKKRLYDPSLGKWTAKRADAVGSVSKRDLKTAGALWQLKAGKSHWVPNAICFDDFHVGPSRREHVVFVGRLEHRKGIQTFLQVAELICKDVEDVDFLVLGDGSLREYAEAFSKKRCSGRLRVLGHVPHRMVADLLARAAALVLPSYAEGLPTVCLEALASGTPVVATRVGGTPEVVIEGKTGFLFRPGDTARCREMVMALLGKEKLRRKMGLEGRNLVEKFYTWDRVLEKVEGIYRTIAG